MSVMTVNNEIGTVQPLDAVAGGGPAPGARSGPPHRRRAGRPWLDVAHRHRAGRPGGGERPQVRRAQGERCPGAPARGPGRVPGIHGGGQERGRRSGTPQRGRHRRPWPRPCRPPCRARDDDGGAGGGPAGPARRRPGRPVAGAGRDRAARATRWPGILHLRFAGVESEALVVLLDEAGVAVSAGAACSSGAVEPSHVLTSMGLDPAAAASGIRFSLGVDHHRRGCGPCARPAFRPPSTGCETESGARAGGHVRRSRLVGGRRAAGRVARHRPRWWGPPSSCGAAPPTRGAARWPMSRTPGGWPISWGSSITCSTSPPSSRRGWWTPTWPATPTGRTPNPCIECNRHLKFDRLLDRARVAGVRRRGHRPPRPGAATPRRALPAVPGGRPGQGPVLRAGHAGPGAAGPLPVPGGRADQGRGPGRGRPARPAHRRTSRTARTSASSVPTRAGPGFLGDRVPLHAGRLVDHETGDDLGGGRRRGAGHGGTAAGDGPRHRRAPSVRHRGRRAGPPGRRRVRRRPSLAPERCVLHTVAWVDGRARRSAPGGTAPALAQCSAHGRPVPCTVTGHRPDRDRRRPATGLTVAFADAPAPGGTGPDRGPLRPGPARRGPRLGDRGDGEPGEGRPVGDGGALDPVARAGGAAGPDRLPQPALPPARRPGDQPTPSTTPWCASCGPSRPTTPTWSCPTRPPRQVGAAPSACSHRWSTACR